MKNNQKVIIVSIGLIALGVYFFYKQGKQEAQTAKTDTDSESSLTVKPDWNKVLKKGSQGIEVEKLQKALGALKADGYFGNLTEARLKKIMNVTQTSINDYNKFITKKIK